jgi:hypothetical protein
MRAGQSEVFRFYCVVYPGYFSAESLPKVEVGKSEMAGTLLICTLNFASFHSQRSLVDQE